MRTATSDIVPKICSTLHRNFGQSKCTPSNFTVHVHAKMKPFSKRGLFNSSKWVLGTHSQNPCQIYISETIYGE